MKIPRPLLERHTALLGMNGTGKTSIAKVAIAEPLLTEGARVHILDPAGAWWGLRLNRDGKTASKFRPYIFGGRHGDYPLRAKDGAILAEAFATSSDSAIFDTSEMTGGDRTEFFIGFAETLFRRNRGRLYLIIDEAHVFMPQAGAKVSGRVPAMIHAGNNLVSLGRGRGFRITMISQRAAKLHKDALTQAHSLFALRVMAPQDRKAMADWIADQAAVATGVRVMESLATLKPGEGWVWSPQDSFLERVAFPRPKSFDSSSDDAGDHEAQLEPIRIEDLTGRLAAIEVERKANDPAALKAELARLRGELKMAQALGPVIDTEKMEAACKAAEARGVAKGAQKAAAIYTSAIHGALDEVNKAVWKFAPDDVQPTIRAAARPPERKAASRIVPLVQRGVTASEVTAAVNGKAENEILRSLAMWAAYGDHQPSIIKVAIGARRSPRSSGFNNARGALKTAGLVHYPASGSMALTDLGRSVAPDPDPGLVFDRLIGLPALGAPERDILKALHDGEAGEEWSLDSLAAAISRSTSSSGFNNARGKLRSLGIVTYPSQGFIKLEEWVRT